MQKLKIAIIEDDIAIQQMYKFRLEHEGFEVRTANNGAEGLELALKFQPHLLLLDLKMPVMNGDDMLEQLRASAAGSDIRVIVLTNISRDEAPRKLHFLHVDRYIVKAHHTPKQVTEVIHEVLGL